MAIAASVMGLEKRPQKILQKTSLKIYKHMCLKINEYRNVIIAL